MGKKNYITEITDTFGSKINSKEALKLAKKMKSAQLLAYPSSEYKTKLKDRLHNIYLIDQGADISSRFSIFQIFGAFASFAFIAGTLFMVFDVRQDTQQNIYTENFLREEISIPTQKDNNNIGGNYNQLQSIVDEDVEKETEILPNTNPGGEVKVVNKIISKKSSVDPADQDLAIPLAEPQESVEQIDASSRIMDDPINELFIPSASSTMMMDGGAGEIQEMSFLDICSEYDGILSDDGVYCIFSQGLMCEKYNIYECALQDTQIQANNDIEIDLEELIEAYGQ